MLDLSPNRIINFLEVYKYLMYRPTVLPFFPQVLDIGRIYDQLTCYVGSPR
jgi:hypothetical protein